MENGIVRMIQLKEGYQVYTRTVGKGLPILLLHGGPGCDHTVFQIFEKYIDLEKYALVYYDQLGSTNSDKIDNTDLLSLPRYVDEVEQVRKALGLDRFVLLGHSWGGLLCIEYALKYQADGHMAGMVISDMLDSIEDYLTYLNHLRETLLTEEELAYAVKLEAEGRGNAEDPRYKELIERLYANFTCRLKPVPDVLQNPDVPARVVYEHFQGDNEYVMTGALLGWDRRADIHNIMVKALSLGAKYDSADPTRMKKMGEEMPNGQYYICPEGSHLCFWDDSEHYFTALNQFLAEL